MKSSLDMNFGLIIAFLLPGFIFIYGLSFTFPQMRDLLSYTNMRTTSIGAFFFVTLASLALGLLISAVRWLVVDWILSLIGIKQKDLDFRNLNDKDVYASFMMLVDNHYRYYQYYANSLVSIVGVAVVYFVGGGTLSLGLVLAAILVAIALALGAGDSCRKYHNRAAEVVGVKGG